MALLILKVKVIVDQEGQSTLRALHAVVYQNIVGIAVRRCRGHNMDEEQYNYAHECSEVFTTRKVMIKYWLVLASFPGLRTAFVASLGTRLG